MGAFPLHLSPEALRRVCDPDTLSFQLTSELPELTDVIGQPRAVEALEFGSRMASHGFNLFALGLPGSGKTTLITDYLKRRAAAQPAPPDLCYVNNFEKARQPTALRLPAGSAAQFKQDIAALVAELRVAIARAFESKEYEGHRDKLLNALKKSQAQEFERIEDHVAKFGFALVKAPGGLLLVPAMNGKPLTESELDALGEEAQAKLIKLRERLQAELEEALQRLRDLEKNARQAIDQLETETALSAAAPVVDDVRRRYRQQPNVLAYLDALQADVVEHADDFHKSREGEAPALPFPLPTATSAEDPFVRYHVNVMVDNRGLTGAPVIVESNPTYHNLVGRIEHQSTWGAVSTNFTLVKPGALHRANGGYLIIPARECLLNPYAWEGLKRALKDRVVKVEELGTQFSLLSTVTLEPEPVPLEVKVVLIGSPLIYYLLQAYDEDFQKLFKVKADFTTRMARTPEAEHAYALFVNTILAQDKSLPFDRGAVARVVEYGSRAAEDQDKLSTRFGEIADLIREAAHRAAQNAHTAVTAQDVKATEDARRYRQNLLEENLQEAIARGSLLIETTGRAVGRLNGLSVLGLGDFAFGHPARITATAGPGRRGVLSIEREVELSGPIHGKGVLILSGFLTHQYGQAGPLNLAASLVFEQSYGMVEGDSASLAELCALLSAISAIPLRQDVAVTGSVNQHGQVQAVGGVAEKIEGFFDVCRERGLTGAQGVLIPASNRPHLMLRDDVVEAVRAGQFHVWAAEHVAEALALLTDCPAGERDADGAFPPGTVHRAVADQLTKYAALLKVADAARENGRAQELVPLN
jgi:lon-related putative ATP-dependent protease